jgi:hypothetical protein
MFRTNFLASNIKTPLLYYNKTNENSITLNSRRIQDHINVRAFIRKDIELTNNKELLTLFRNNYLRTRLLLTADFFMSKFDDKKEGERIKKIAKKDLKTIYGKKPLDIENKSYENFVKKMTSK